MASSIASASAAIRWVRLSSPVRDRAATASTVARRGRGVRCRCRTIPWARTGLPSAPANQQPDSSIQSTGAGRAGAHAILDPIRHAIAAIRWRMAASASARIDARPARSVCANSRRSPATPPGYPGKTDADVIGPGDGVAREIPDKRGLAERTGQDRSMALRQERMSRSPRFGTLPVILTSKDSAVPRRRP